jgi:hypothetical protein
MAVLAGHKTVGAPFGNGGDLVSVTYDFSVDGGAVADYDVLTADGSILVEYVVTDVKTALTCATDFAIDLGKAAGGIEFWSNNAKAVYALDAQVGPAAGEVKFVELADGEKIVMGIETAAATAGKMVMLFRIYKRPDA